jgi:hypothetical protein
MLVYSRTINSFLLKVKKMAHFIMIDEMGLDVRKSRFLWRGYLYPLHFVCFEDPKKLGYFQATSYQLGLHKKLMYLAKDEVLANILRHELAHFYTFLLYGEKFHQMAPHGEEFQNVCKRFQWGIAVSRAYSDLEQDNLASAPDQEFERVKEKIQKLLALSQSENVHEAEAATLKANEYLIKYNLKGIETGENNEDSLGETVVTAVFQAKRMNATLNALYDVLQFFHVQPVFNRTGEGVKLDVVGSRLNVDVANYIAKFLNNEFEILWKQTQKELGLKGLKKKNSYIYGLASGLKIKLKAERINLRNSPRGKDLVVLEGLLQQRVQMAFPRLSRQQGPHANLDPYAHQRGKQDGTSIQIRPGVSQGNKGKLLTSF